MNKGFLITFEGGEGCGKSSQIKLFTKFLEEEKIDFILSREPGGTNIGEDIRNLLLHSKNEIDSKTEFLLFSSGRADHIKNVVKPALEAGKVVVLDRYYDSSFAYQGYAGNLNLDDIKLITDFAIDGCVPDLTILLDISYEDGFARKAKDDNLKNLDRMESKGKEYHDKVRRGYLELAKNEPNRIKIVDATKNKEEIFKEIVNLFFEKINKKQKYNFS